MKKILYWMLLAIPVLALIGCDENDNSVAPPANQLPAAPQGVYSVTGNQTVYVYFNGIYDANVNHYNMWRSLQATTGYTQIGTRAAESNPNLDLIIYEYTDTELTNGTTYYYAVSSVNNDGLQSDLSAENVFDTPRPEGSVTLFPNTIERALSGYNFETNSILYDTSAAADIFVDVFQGTYYLNARDNSTDLQDMGYTASFTDIGYAPDSGWSALGFTELIPKHTYVIWTRDNHYAKVRPLTINQSGSVAFQWAYQTATANPELAITFGHGPQKPSHGPDYLIKTPLNTKVSR